MQIWDGLLNVFEDALTWLHGALEPLFGLHSWGWAIIAVTLVARLALTPLTLKGMRNMRAMQTIQPKLKELQKKHKVDRELMRKDPATYKARRTKLNEETMALYKQEGVNPAAGCLPLIAQAPIFIALYYVLQRMAALANAEFYFLTDFIGPAAADQGLGATVRQAGWPAFLLVALMVAAMFFSQRQTLAANAGGEMAQQQKIIMYVMPAFLAFISVNLPVAVMLYWATTNLWQWGQQAFILREVRHDLETAMPIDASRPKRPASRGGGGRTNGKAATTKRGSKAKADNPSGSKAKPASKAAAPAKAVAGTAGSKREHLPRRNGGRSG